MVVDVFVVEVELCVDWEEVYVVVVYVDLFGLVLGVVVGVVEEVWIIVVDWGILGYEGCCFVVGGYLDGIGMVVGDGFEG